MRDLRSKEAIHSPKVTSLGDVMLTHWEDNRESGRVVACGNLSLEKSRREFLNGRAILLGPR